MKTSELTCNAKQATDFCVKMSCVAKLNVLGHKKIIFDIGRSPNERKYLSIFIRCCILDFSKSLNDLKPVTQVRNNSILYVGRDLNTFHDLRWRSFLTIVKGWNSLFVIIKGSFSNADRGVTSQMLPDKLGVVIYCHKFKFPLWIIQILTGVIRLWAVGCCFKELRFRCWKVFWLLSTSNIRALCNIKSDRIIRFLKVKNSMKKFKTP